MFYCCDTVLQDDDPTRAIYFQVKALSDHCGQRLCTPQIEISIDMVRKTKFYCLPPSPQNKN
jgi:hypothetical protein